MSSSHRSSHSNTKGKHSSKSKSSKKDDWSEITDPEERRRVQNRIAQRKFRDKAKDTKEREERDAVNRANAHHAYELTDPRDMSCDDPNGLPWGSVSLIHVMSTGKAKEAESRRGSQSRSRETETQSSYKHSPSQTVWEDPDQDGYYEATSFFDDGDQAYYSGSHEGSSR